MSRELLWIDKSLVSKLKLLEETDEIMEQDLKQYIKDFKDGIEQLGEDIDSNVLDIRVKAQRARESYKNVVETEIESINEMWEQLDSKRYEAYKTLKSAKESIDSITNEVNSLKKSINNINFYTIDRMIEVVDKVSSMDEKQLELLERLFKNN
ncbi:hypothetical protein [Romboutsia sp.]|uniref:hypothetical protein n=1 Tax=Romboutsia sp. TaxID=1965302 RepID=UPI002BA0AAC4|nr:hypothetical protein [Romboutsia sp.]HSQ90228.1 hypothetical protein [Romboutsia sp.]